MTPCQTQFLFFGFFQTVCKMVRHSFGFSGRKKRPAPDPVNALLSFGYTLLYAEISSLLDGLGYDPYLGYYHQPRYGHATLASDLMEEFRSPLVDRLTLYLINDRVFKEDDFFTHPKSGSSYLNIESRKRYFVEYERFVSKPVPSEEGPVETGFRGLFRRQAERLKSTLTAGRPYTPYLFRQ